MIQKLKENKKRILSISLILCLIISSGALGLYLNSYGAPSPRDQIIGGAITRLSNMQMGLNISVYSPSGQLLRSEYQPHDLILNNFITLMAYLFTGYTSSTGLNNFQMKDTGGSTHYYTFNPDGSPCGSSTTGLLCASTGILAGGEVGIGNSSTSPARTDYKLGQQVGSLNAVSFPGWDGSAENITISGSVTSPVSTTIYEAAYAMHLLYCNSATSCDEPQSISTVYDDVLMMHDTFTGISVSIGDIVALVYTLHLPSDFTNNFGYLMQTFLANSGGTTLTTATSPTLESGSTQSITVYYSGGSLQTYFFDNCAGASTSYPSISAQVGTGSTAPALTDYKLATPVATFGPVIGTASSPNGTFAGSMTLSSATAVTEWGLWMSVGEGTTSANWILLYRIVISTVNIAKNQGVTVGLQVQF